MIWLATVLVGQARARVVDEFIGQEHVHVTDSARTIETELNDVLEDLHFAVWANNLYQRILDPVNSQQTV